MNSHSNGILEDRVATFVYRMQAVRNLADAYEGVLTVNLGGRVSRPRVSLQTWSRHRPTNLPARVWSKGQQRLLDLVKARACMQDVNSYSVYSDPP